MRQSFRLWMLIASVMLAVAACADTGASGGASSGEKPKPAGAAY